MTIADIRDKLNEDWARYKYPLIIKVKHVREGALPVYILFTYQGLFWNNSEYNQLRYIDLNSILDSRCEILKIFYTDDKDSIDKILNGTFTEANERDIYEMSLKEFDSSIEDPIPSENEQKTQDLMNKFGLI